MTVIPDSIEPYLGYKALNMDGYGNLFSPQQRILWPPRERLTAHCTRGLSNWRWVPIEGEPRSIDDTITYSSSGATAYATAVSSTSYVRVSHPEPKPTNPLPEGWSWSWEPLTHDAPSEGCHCGIYVVDRPEACDDYIGVYSVLVEVALWGITIIANQGARGQYAYPQRLISARANAVHFRHASMLYGIPVLIAEDWCDVEFVDQ